MFTFLLKLFITVISGARGNEESSLQNHVYDRQRSHDYVAYRQVWYYGGNEIIINEFLHHFYICSYMFSMLSTYRETFEFSSLQNIKQ